MSPDALHKILIPWLEAVGVIGAILAGGVIAAWRDGRRVRQAREAERPS